MINFTKMHGLGNDFVVMNNLDGDISLSVDEIRKLSDRHFGIGFDQLLMVESATSKEADFRYLIFNADGSEVSQCGNGAGLFDPLSIHCGVAAARLGHPRQQFGGIEFAPGRGSVSGFF